jgi:hypothetical protein
VSGEDPEGAGVPAGAAAYIKWYLSGNISLLSVVEKKRIHHATQKRKKVT